MNLLKKLWHLFSFLLSECKRCFILRGSPGGKRRVLIVRLDGIGDFFIWLPELMKLRNYYADSEITLLANELWSDVAEKLLPGCRVIPFELRYFMRDFRYRIKILMQLRREGFDIVVQPRFSREFLVEDMITRWCAAPRSTAFRSDRRSINPRLMKWSDNWYTELIILPEEIKNEHLINAFFTAEVTASSAAGTLFPPEFSDLPDLPEAWTETPYFLIVPGAADPGRRWPPEKLAEVAESISGRLALRGIICGGGDDRKAAQAILLRNGDKNLLDLTGKTSILQLLALVKKSRLVIGNDTGAIHIAASCGVKAFCVLGGGQWGRFLPYPDTAENAPECVYHKLDCYNCNWRCIFERKPDAPYPCVNSVTPAELSKKIENG